MVANTARVSYGKHSEALNEDKDGKLISYLAKHGHTSPFRHPQLRFRVQCSIMVERQLFKHQVGWCLSGESEITFIKPSGMLERIPIKNLFDIWSTGRPHQPSEKDALLCRKRIKRKKVKVLNEATQRFETGHIKEIIKSEAKEMFKITLENGRSIKCSRDHKIMTDKGWATLRNGLRVGSFVMCNGVKFVGNGMYRDREFMSKLRESGASVAEMAKECGCGYDNIRKWLRILGLGFKPEETRFPKKNVPWNLGVNGYKLNLTEEGKRSKSKWGKFYNRPGPESRLWRGGITSDRDMIASWTRKIARQVHKKYNFTCQNCGQSSGELHAHHIVPVAQNADLAYDFDNLITVCARCHGKIHASLDSEEEFANRVLSSSFVKFEYKKRIGSRPKFKSKPKPSKVVSIQSVGMEDCYDIEMEGPHHNFVANGIVVHNSANSISGRYVDFSDSYDLPKRLRFQSKDSKQGSGGDLPDDLNEVLVADMDAHVANGRLLYARLCEAGVSKEQARSILPLCLETTFIWTGSLQAFFHLCHLRLKPDAQKETRDVVAEMLRLVKEGGKFKLSLEAFGL